MSERISKMALHVLYKVREQIMKSTILNMLQKFGLRILRENNYLNILNESKLYKKFRILEHSHPISTDLLYKIIENSKSQLGQDLFALQNSDFSTGGYFVEFGATNGINLSNTYILERFFGWSGILAEPAKCWHDDLYRNRRAHIETDCLWSSSGQILQFSEANHPQMKAEVSTISSFVKRSTFKSAFKSGVSYSVNTISLNDLLKKYKAPKRIDFLSIDTEGSEYEILSNFQFGEYDIRTITCEHNFTESREKVYQLLTSYGYKRKFTDLSAFDDWYVKE